MVVRDRTKLALKNGSGPDLPGFICGFTGLSGS